MIPGLFRTLVGLVIAWIVFRFLDRMFGAGRRGRGTQGGRTGNGRGAQGRRDASAGNSRSAQGRQAAKDDHLGEYVDYEEVDPDE
jgi:hypothetical protein